MITLGCVVSSMNYVGFAELVLTGGWYIWWGRRQLVHGENIQSPARSALSIATLTSNYMRSRKKTARRNEVWKRPPEGKLMINIDASFDINSGSGSTGVIIRDVAGGCLAAAQSFLAQVVDAPMAEAHALEEGLLLEQLIGAQRLIFQTDCMEVVDTMKNGGFSATAATTIYDECIAMWRDLVAVHIQHCNRAANQVAHELARIALSLKNSCIWLDEPPTFILEHLVNDVTCLSNQ